MAGWDYLGFQIKVRSRLMGYPYVPPRVVSSVAQSSQGQVDSLLGVLVKVKEFVNLSFTDDLGRLIDNVDSLMALNDRIRGRAPYRARSKEEYLQLTAPKYDPYQQQFVNETLKSILTPLADLVIQRLVRGTIWQ